MVIEPAQHSAYRSKVDHTFAAGHSALVILTQATIAIEPSERALHDLAFRQNHKAALLLRATHNIEHKGETSVYPLSQHPGVTLIRPHPPQAWHTAIGRVEQFLCAIAIGQGGAADNHHSQQTKHIDQQMPFAT